MSALLAAARLTVLILVLAVLIGPHSVSVRTGGRLAKRLPILFHRVALWVLRVRVTEIGAPPPGKPVLVLANHVSWVDIVVLGSLRPLSFVAKSEVAEWPVFGTLARLQRTVFIERTRRAAASEVNATIARRLADGEVVVLFPEGTTSDGNRVLPFRAPLVGAARMALSDGANVDHVVLQPLALTYLRRHGLPLGRRERAEIAWYGDMELAPHLGAFLVSGPVDVEVRWGAPIPFARDSDRKAATLAAEISVREAVTAAARGRACARGVV